MGYTVHGILQARKLEWVAFPFSRGFSQPRDRTQVYLHCRQILFCRRILYQLSHREALWRKRTSQKLTTLLLHYSVLHVRSAAQSCLTLWDPIDYTVHGILQARILEWVASPFSRGSSQPRDQTQVSCIAGRFFTS